MRDECREAAGCQWIFFVSQRHERVVFVCGSFERQSGFPYLFSTDSTGDARAARKGACEFCEGVFADHIRIPTRSGRVARPRRFPKRRLPGRRLLLNLRLKRVLRKRMISSFLVAVANRVAIATGVGIARAVSRGTAFRQEAIPGVNMIGDGVDAEF